MSRTLLRDGRGRFRRLNLADVLAHVLVDGPIPVERWGKDHWSTLLYVDTRIVDHRGYLARIVRDGSRMGPRGHDPHMRVSREYPTRLRNPDVDLRGHTDYDCVADAIAAGYLTVKHWDRPPRHYFWPDTDERLPIDRPVTGEDLEVAGPSACFAWTDAGYDLISRLRRHRSERRDEPFVP